MGRHLNSLLQKAMQIKSLATGVASSGQPATLWQNAQSLLSQARTTVLMPDSQLAKWIHRIALIGSICKYTETPMTIAFESEPFPQPYYSMWELGLFSIFVLDMVCTAHQAFFDDNGRLISDIKLIRKHYWRSKFLDNIISSVPLAFILKPFLPKYIVRYFKVLPIFHVGRYYRAVMDKEMSINASRKYTLFVFFIFVIQVVHWCACAWWLVEQALVNESQSWGRERTLVNLNSDYYKKNPYQRYPYLVEYMVIVFLNRGRLWSSSPIEVILLLALNGLGTLLIAGYIALFVSHLSNTLRDKVETEQTIQSIQTYLRYHRISHHAAQRVVDYYRHILLDWHGQICTDDVLSDLPVVVRSEVTYMVRGSHLEQCPLFAQCSLSFIQFLCANSTELYLTRAETLTVCGAGGTAMFVIKHGHAHVLSDDNRRVWGEVGPGGMVGEVATLFNQTHSCTVVALCPCEVIVIRQHVLNYAIEAFPEDGAFVLDLAGERQRQSLSNMHHARLNTVSYPPAVFKRITLQRTKKKPLKGEKKLPFARRKDRAAALREELVDAAIFVVKSRWLKKASKDRRYSIMASADASATSMSMSMSGASSFFGGTGAAPPIIARIPVMPSPSSPASSSTHSIQTGTSTITPTTVLVEPAVELAPRPRQRVRTNSIVSFTKPLGPIAEVSTGQTMPRPRHNKSHEIRLSSEATSGQSTRATPSLDAGINFVFTSGTDSASAFTPTTISRPVASVQPNNSAMMAPPPLTIQAPSTPSLFSVAVPPPPRTNHILYRSMEGRGSNEDTGRPLTAIESNESFVSATSIVGPGTSGRQSSQEPQPDLSADGLQQSVYLDAISKDSDEKLSE